jgi:hypothetical protein
MRHPSSVYSGETTTIEVGTGPNKQTFYVHRGLLSFYSGYFRAALDGGFLEANTGVVKLEIEEPTVFDGFVKWLYTTKVCKDDITEQNNAEYFNFIVKLWIFGDRREIPLLMNEMIDFLHQSVVRAWMLPSNSVTEVYDNTTEESALRRLLVDMYANLAAKKHAVSFTPGSDTYNKQFRCDLVKSLIADKPRRPLLSKSQVRGVEMCPSFHVHEEGVTCTGDGIKRSSDEMED